MHIPRLKRKLSFELKTECKEQQNFLQILLSQLHLLKSALLQQQNSRKALERQFQIMRVDLQKSRAESARLRARIFRLSQSESVQSDLSKTVKECSNRFSKGKLTDSKQPRLPFQQLQCKSQLLKNIWNAYQIQIGKNSKYELLVQQLEEKLKLLEISRSHASSKARLKTSFTIPFNQPLAQQLSQCKSSKECNSPVQRLKTARKRNVQNYFSSLKNL